ncbi:MAG: aldehyde dehydrogenase family protein [Pikeienuella sp.]
MDSLKALNLINGEWQQPRSERFCQRADPRTGLARAAVQCVDDADIDAAVAAAKSSGWAEASVDERLSVLDALIGQLNASKQELAQTVSDEIGADLEFALAQHVGSAVGHLNAIRDALAHDQSDQTPWPGKPDHRVRFEPIGVVALITPWNWPINQVALKVGAALAAGCPMVLKPSELTPDSSMAFARVIAAVSPDGVFNMVLGDGETGAALVAHPGISAISFTGSTAVGRRIAGIAGQDLKRVGLELGGKSPNILFADCDLETAMTQGIAHCFRNGGQSCNAATRMLVERSVYKHAQELAAEAALAWSPEATPQNGLNLGPIISARHFDRVQELILTGVQEGASLLTGGPGKANGQAGFYPRPTVFADVTPEMTIWKEEIFGPVLTMTPFDSEEKAISLANDTPYGLAGYIQTSDAECATRVANAMEVGMVQVNGCSRAPGAPFGGVKASGDSREAGIWGIRSFQTVKSISGANAE